MTSYGGSDAQMTYASAMVEGGMYIKESLTRATSPLSDNELHSGSSDIFAMLGLNLTTASRNKSPFGTGLEFSVFIAVMLSGCKREHPFNNRMRPISVALAPSVIRIDVCCCCYRVGVAALLNGEDEGKGGDQDEGEWSKSVVFAPLTSTCVMSGYFDAIALQYKSPLWVRVDVHTCGQDCCDHISITTISNICKDTAHSCTLAYPDTNTFRCTHILCAPLQYFRDGDSCTT